MDEEEQQYSPSSKINSYKDQATLNPLNTNIALSQVTRFDTGMTTAKTESVLSPLELASDDHGIDIRFCIFPSAFNYSNHKSEGLTS